MLKKLLIAVLMLTSFFGALTVPAQSVFAVTHEAPSSDLQSGEFMFRLDKITHKDIKEEKWIRGGINFVFERIITIMATTVGAAAVLVMSIGGFMILTSAGNDARIMKGKELMWKAALGLVFVFGAYILVTTIQLLIKSIYNA